MRRQPPSRACGVAVLVIELGMAFNTIAFQADLSRYEDEEFDELAKKNCGESPDIKQNAIKELRQLIYERGQCSTRRTDDAYLLRFLRCRKFIPKLAHKLIFRYDQFRRSYPHLYECNAFGLAKVKHVLAGLLPDTPEYGRIVLMRFGRWENDKISIGDLVRCALLVVEILMMCPMLQILGITVIFDLKDINIRQISQLTPTIAHQIVSIMGVSFPVNLHGVHVVKHGWIFNAVFHLFKSFIPAAAWKRLHFHGYDMTSLHKHIRLECLPPEYDGTNECVIGLEEWLPHINRFKDDFFVQELRDLGYIVEDSKFMREVWDMS